MNRQIFKDILNDLKVELADEFDKNFERKAFFNEPWPGARHETKGSLMVRTGALRRSIQARISGDSIGFQSSLPYASIHNEGGVIKITTRMKRFFWAMYYKAEGAVSYRVSDRKRTNSQRNRKLTAEGEFWKALALMKVGEKIKVPQRRFIGQHPHVDRAVGHVLDIHAKELDIRVQDILKKLNQKFK
ncbi:hypothetical protein KTO58_19825 [Chitinophaga pendula]|uniref:hypothetical protein n=1 Tax=Chitinophaga TaxID=79328 RepID=UPI000BAF5C08|nr:MULTISPECIES: hypothetical protein [Chitinophaga]ASZ11083.1 hypothetical protein CK934_08975 [Chitinophaga sp. MD30]UCJ05920.1 hypothetical protein KTO58_19825 [Chitinophaga pendula]